MTVLELLNDASKWTQGSSARDAQGRGLVSSDARACCWCLMGAVIHCYPSPQDMMSAEALSAVLKLAGAAKQLYPILGQYGLVTFNDYPSTTFEHIRKVVELANV